MSKPVDSFVDKVAYPLLVLAIGPTFTLIGSKLQAGDWLAWLKQIPSWGYVIFFGMTIGWMLMGSIVRRIRHLKQRNLPTTPPIFTIPQWGYVTVGTLNYKEVVWRVQIPAPPPWQGLTPAEAHASRVDIKTPPFCPKCETELEQNELFFGNYRWSCVRCSFSIKSKVSYYREAVRAEKIAQSWWEKEAKE